MSYLLHSIIDVFLNRIADVAYYPPKKPWETFFVARPHAGVVFSKPVLQSKKGKIVRYVITKQIQ